MRQFALAAFLALVALCCDAAERWETLPPTPAPIATDRSGEAEANGIKIHYAIYGQGSPVIFLHGGLANTDYWGNQVPAVAAAVHQDHGMTLRHRRDLVAPVVGVGKAAMQENHR